MKAYSFYVASEQDLTMIDLSGHLRRKEGVLFQ
jgi:hypothetical protein